MMLTFEEAVECWFGKEEQAQYANLCQHYRSDNSRQAFFSVVVSIAIQVKHISASSLVCWLSKLSEKDNHASQAYLVALQQEHPDFFSACMRATTNLGEFHDLIGLMRDLTEDLGYPVSGLAALWGSACDSKMPNFSAIVRLLHRHYDSLMAFYGNDTKRVANFSEKMAFVTGVHKLLEQAEGDKKLDALIPDCEALLIQHKFPVDGIADLLSGPDWREKLASLKEYGGKFCNILGFRPEMVIQGLQEEGWSDVRMSDFFRGHDTAYLAQYVSDFSSTRTRAVSTAFPTSQTALTFYSSQAQLSSLLGSQASSSFPDASLKQVFLEPQAGRKRSQALDPEGAPERKVTKSDSVVSAPLGGVQPTPDLDLSPDFGRPMDFDAFSELFGTEEEIPWFSLSMDTQDEFPDFFTSSYSP